MVYFYIDFRDSEKQGYAQFLRSLLVQLSSQDKVAFNVLAELHDHCGNGQRTPSCTELVRALRQAIEALPLAYIILDALDECRERKELLEFLKSAAGWKLDNLRLLFASRRLTDIEDALNYIAARHVSLESNLVDIDIGHYVRTHLRGDRALQWPSDGLMEEIERCLTEGAHGMYVFADSPLIIFMRRCGQSMGGVATNAAKTYLQVSLG